MLPNTLFKRLGLVLAVVVIAATGLFLAGAVLEVRAMGEVLERQGRLSAEAVAVSAGHFLAAHDAEALDTTLEAFIGHPEIERLVVLGTSGAVLTDTRPDAPLAGPALTPPADVSAMVSEPEGRRVFWHRIVEHGQSLGWVRLTYDLSGLSDVSRRMWIEHLATSASAIAGGLAFVFLVLRGPIDTFNRAVRFAETLDSRMGDRLESRPCVDEADRLVVALNDTSRRLRDQDAALRRAREQLTEILESMSEAFFAVDSEMNLIYANPRAQALFAKVGADPTHPFENRVLGDSFFSPVRSALDTKRALEYEVRFTPTKQWFAVRARPFPDGAAVLCLDVSERHAFIERLQTLNAELEDKVAERTRDLEAARFKAERANAAKSDFLANMSHELRTPLNAVIGFADILKGEILGPLGQPRYAEYAEDIHASGRHLLDLINDILDLSKTEAGQMELDESDVALAPLVDGALRMVAERAAKHGVRLNGPDRVDLPVVRADERKLRQILLNLLTNAIKFTPNGGRVALDVETRADGGVRLAVRDTGVGIAEEDIPKVLEPFGQAKAEGVTVDEGTGIGLPLTKRLAELHGGTFTITSALGEGTTVAVDLPAERTVADAV